ncbi:hypothetical protein F383_01493 [Gossypium arboreum]|uniref:Uncharacterized protein n=1 Tax=Gossypium arboreum TaxID=29729 RepID=A0A0B0NDU2_GOSAR|nr:hypothetical protein F383_13527 [Gossypium arboreum]KHG26373.1 hypothetical protein F383_01493 [Gossypium arboreum]
MSGTCISIEMRASVRHVWDMHQPRDIQASCKTCLGHDIEMRASVRPVWDMASCRQSSSWIIASRRRSQSHYP